MDPSELNKIDPIEEQMRQQILAGNLKDSSNKQPVILNQAGNRKLVDSLGDEDYVLLSKEELPSGGRFYPPDMEILIRPAKTKEVEKFSMMDKKSVNSIIDELLSVITSCTKLKYKSPSIRYGSPTELLDCDRIYVLIAIRDITFTNENVIEVETFDAESQEYVKVVINKDNLEFDAPPHEFMEKFYIQAKRAICIKSKPDAAIQFDWTLAPPPTYTLTAIIEYAKDLHQKGKQTNSAFITYIPFMVENQRNKSNQPIKLDTNRLEILRADFEKMSVEKFAILDNIMKNYMTKFGVNGIKAKTNTGKEIRAGLATFLDKLPDFFTFSGELQDIFDLCN